MSASPGEKVGGVLAFLAASFGLPGPGREGFARHGAGVPQSRADVAETRPADPGPGASRPGRGVGGVSPRGGGGRRPGGRAEGRKLGVARPMREPGPSVGRSGARIFRGGEAPRVAFEEAERRARLSNLLGRGRPRQSSSRDRGPGPAVPQPTWPGAGRGAVRQGRSTGGHGPQGCRQDPASSSFRRTSRGPPWMRGCNGPCQGLGADGAVEARYRQGLEGLVGFGGFRSRGFSGPRGAPCQAVPAAAEVRGLPGSAHQRAPRRAGRPYLPSQVDGLGVRTPLPAEAGTRTVGLAAGEPSVEGGGAGKPAVKTNSGRGLPGRARRRCRRRKQRSSPARSSGPCGWRALVAGPRR